MTNTITTTTSTTTIQVQSTTITTNHKHNYNHRRNQPQSQPSTSVMPSTSATTTAVIKKNITTAYNSYNHNHHGNKKQDQNKQSLHPLDIEVRLCLEALALIPLLDGFGLAVVVAEKHPQKLIQRDKFQGCNSQFLVFRSEIKTDGRVGWKRLGATEEARFQFLRWSRSLRNQAPFLKICLLLQLSQVSNFDFFAFDAAFRFTWETKHRL